jgi:hypothetical protein
LGCRWVQKNNKQQQKSNEVNMQKDYQSSLGRMQPKRIDIEKVKKDGWKNDGILVVKKDDERLNWTEKELIKQIGNKIYNNQNR